MYRSTPVVSNREIADRVRYLELDTDLEFRPGQCISLALGDSERYYSIASGVNEPHIGVIFDVIATGELTPALAGLRQGDPVRVLEDLTSESGAQAIFAESPK